MDGLKIIRLLVRRLNRILELVAIYRNSVGTAKDYVVGLPVTSQRLLIHSAVAKLSYKLISNILIEIFFQSKLTHIYYDGS